MAMDEFLMSEKLTLQPGVEEFIDDAYKEGIHVVLLTTYSKSGDQIGRSIVEKLGKERISKLKIVGYKEVDLCLYTQLVNDTGLSSSVDKQLAKEAIKVVFAEKQRIADEVASMLQLSVDIDTSPPESLEKIIAAFRVGGEVAGLHKKLPFGSSVHGSFGVQDKSHILEGGKGIYTTTFTSSLLTGRGMMTMIDIGILKHFSSEYVEQRKLDAAFTVAKHIPILEDESSVLAFGKVQTTVPLPVITDAGNLQEAPVANLDRRMIKKVLQLRKP
ncbi:hypothetical protein ACFX1X_020287 [Malus domestica]